MLQHIGGEQPFTILDFGCGPGRDLKIFTELGHIAIGLEGTTQLAAMARAYSGCEVWQQDFLKLDLTKNHLDGVFANASLFHVPSQELPLVLLELRACLKPGGVLFNSNQHGHNEEGWSRGRYGAYLDFRDLAPLFNFRGFCSTDPLLPSCRPATRKEALAGDHMASVSASIEARARCQSRHDGDVGQFSLMSLSDRYCTAIECLLLRVKRPSVTRAVMPSPSRNV
jgi:SAM-dependent methyltransferase